MKIFRIIRQAFHGEWSRLIRPRPVELYTLFPDARLCHVLRAPSRAAATPHTVHDAYAPRCPSRRWWSWSPSSPSSGGGSLGAPPSRTGSGGAVWTSPGLSGRSDSAPVRSSETGSRGRWRGTKLSAGWPRQLRRPTASAPGLQGTRAPGLAALPSRHLPPRAAGARRPVCGTGGGDGIVGGATPHHAGSRVGRRRVERGADVPRRRRGGPSRGSWPVPATQAGCGSTIFAWPLYRFTLTRPSRCRWAAMSKASCIRIR